MIKKIERNNIKNENEIYKEFCDIMKYPKNIDEKMIKNTLSYYLYSVNIRFEELCVEIKISFCNIVNQIKKWTKK